MQSHLYPINLMTLLFKTVLQMPTSILTTDDLYDFKLELLGELKKLLQEKNKRMIVCNLSDSIWSTMLATGLDQVFEFIENTTVALASLTFEE